MENIQENLVSNFEQDILRFEATNEYHKAFLLCLSCLQTPELKEKAFTKANLLVKNHSYLIFEKFSKGYRIRVNKPLHDNWLLDIAIKHGYKNIKRSAMSTGFCSTVPCIVIGSFLAKQKMGIGHNKDNTNTIYFHFSTFCDDFKLAKAIGENIIKLYL